MNMRFKNCCGVRRASYDLKRPRVRAKGVRKYKCLHITKQNIPLRAKFRVDYEYAF